MTLAEIRERTAQRKLAGLIPVYPHPAPGVLPTTKCISLGKETGKTVPCQTCAGKVELKTFACSEFGTCTPTRPVEGVACCVGCTRKVTQ